MSPAAKPVEVKAAPVAAPAQTITLAKADQKYEGARTSWFAALKAHDGRSSEAFITACTTKPPAMTKSGKAEDPRGWLKFFVREGVAKLAC